MEPNATGSASPVPAAHLDVLRAHGYHLLGVKMVVQETDDTRTLVLDVPPDLREIFAYLPGQFCTFRVHIEGEEHLRSYSMSSAPETDPDLAVTVKRVPGGLVSNWLNDHVSAGDLVELTRPAGMFCPTTNRGAVVAFCGGSGVTPVMSITRSLLASTDRELRILYASRTPDSVIFDAALADLSRTSGGRLQVKNHFDSKRGFLIAEDVASFARDSLDADFYICGPAPFMDLVETTLVQLGVQPGRIFIERFTVDGVGAAEPRPRPAASTDVTESLTLILKGKSTTTGYQAGDTVLETARRAGLQPPFSCEAGNCATCMAFLQEGSVTMRANNALTPDEVEEGWILTCQSVPTSRTVKVEYESF